MKNFAFLLVALGLLSNVLADDASDCADFPSCALQAAAWEALSAKRYEDAVEITQECTTTFGDLARELQASLSKMPSGKNVHKYGVLNDVGTCYFIKGEALMKLKRPQEALVAYRSIVDDFYYAQAWDPRGWFWAPAAPASKNIALIEAQQKNDF